MKVPRELLAVTALSALSLLVVACGVATVFAVIQQLSPSELWTVPGALRTGLYGTLVFGFVPAIVLGGPAYWMLGRSGRASLAAAASLGAVLGTIVAVIDVSLVPWGSGCGVIVAGLTHLASTRWLALAVRTDRVDRYYHCELTATIHAGCLLDSPPLFQRGRKRPRFNAGATPIAAFTRW